MHYVNRFPYMTALIYICKINKQLARGAESEEVTMCMYLVDGSYLGQRLIGFEVYDSKTKGFLGLTEKQITDKLKRNERVYGIKLGEEDGREVPLLDEEGFHMTNLQIKTGVNGLSWWLDSMDADINIALIVVAVKNEKGKRVFETVNARHARVDYSEEKLKLLLELGIPVAGIKIEKNKLVVCEGVEGVNAPAEVKEGV